MSRSMRRLVDETGESMPDLVNQTAKFVAINAYKGAAGARAAEIRAELNTTSTGASGNRTYTLAEALVVKKARATGKWPKGKNGIRQAARALVASRARSVNWLKAGFIPAFQEFGARGGVRKFNKPPGGASRARKSDRTPSATIEHYDEGIAEKYPLVLVVAVRTQSRFLERLAQRKLQENIRRSGFR
jgi:hypothetical protein